VLGFALIWHIWWLAGLSALALLAAAIGHTFNYHRDFDMSSDYVERTERLRTRELGAAVEGP
jgi:cytochrome o ubiquinol oxidase subunit 1